MKAKELDIVELTEDVKGASKGQRATVIVAFTSPSEAYDLEIVNEDNGDGEILYSILPEQIEVVDNRMPLGELLSINGEPQGK